MLHAAPIIQRTQPVRPHARRRLNLDDAEDQETNQIPRKKPRDKREEPENCTSISIYNITFLNELANDELMVGIYVFL